ncbi:hypothetical protein Tco_0309829 [Tanacetum coccineum]
MAGNNETVSSGIVPDPQDPERNIQLAGTGLPFTSPDEGIRKSQPFPEGTTTDPKDLEGNVQPADKGLPSTVFDKRAAKTMSFPGGPREDEDSDGLIPPTDMEPQTNHVANLSGTGVEYQTDETQSTRLTYQTLTENKGKTSSEVKPGLETLQLTTLADIHAYLLFEDELAQEIDEEEVFAAGDDMEEDTQADKEEHQSPSPNIYKPEPSHILETQVSDSDSSSPDLKKYDNTLPLTQRQLVKYLRKVSRVLFKKLSEEQWAHHEEDRSGLGRVQRSEILELLEYEMVQACPCLVMETDVLLHQLACLLPYHL